MITWHYEFMVPNSSIAVSGDLRKRIKKLAALLDKPQGEIVSQAIEKYEEEIIAKFKESSRKNVNDGKKEDFEEILDTATKLAWESDPGIREVQEKLASGKETIDDFITNDWNTGLRA